MTVYPPKRWMNCTFVPGQRREKDGRRFWTVREQLELYDIIKKAIYEEKCTSMKKLIREIIPMNLNIDPKDIKVYLDELGFPVDEDSAKMEEEVEVTPVKRFVFSDPSPRNSGVKRNSETDLDNALALLRGPRKKP